MWGEVRSGWCVLRGGSSFELGGSQGSPWKKGCLELHLEESSGPVDRETTVTLGRCK